MGLNNFFSVDSKDVDTQRFWPPKFVNPQNYWPLKIDNPKKMLTPKFVDPKLFDPQICLTLHNFRPPPHVFDPPKFLTPKTCCQDLNRIVSFIGTFTTAMAMDLLNFKCNTKEYIAFFIIRFEKQLQYKL